MSFNKSFYAHYFLLLELLFYKYDLVFFDYCCNMTKMFFYTGMQCFRSGSGWRLHYYCLYDAGRAKKAKEEAIFSYIPGY